MKKSKVAQTVAISLSVVHGSFAGYTEILPVPADGVRLWKQLVSGGQPDYVLEADIRKIDVRAVVGDYVLVNKVPQIGVGSGSFGGRNPHYTAKSITNGEFKLPNGADPVAVSSGAFGGQWIGDYVSGRIAFPMRIGGFLETEGYGDPQGFWPDIVSTPSGTATIADYRVLCIDNKGGKVSIHLYYNLSKVKNCDDEWVSFSKDVIKGGLTGRTFAGVADRNGDGTTETVLIYSSKLATRDYADQQLKSPNFNAIGYTIQFDGGGSSQLRVGSKNYVPSESTSNYASRKLWNAIVFGKKPTSDNPPFFSSIAFPASVTRPNKVYFSGYARDDKGLITLTMMVSGPRGNNIKAFSSSISGTNLSLSSYYFDSKNSNYAGLAGNYTVVLWIKDSANQTASSKTFTITVR